MALQYFTLRPATAESVEAAYRKTWNNGARSASTLGKNIVSEHFNDPNNTGEDTEAYVREWRSVGQLVQEAMFAVLPLEDDLPSSPPKEMTVRVAQVLNDLA